MRKRVEQAGGDPQDRAPRAHPDAAGPGGAPADARLRLHAGHRVARHLGDGAAEAARGRVRALRGPAPAAHDLRPRHQRRALGQPRARQGAGGHGVRRRRRARPRRAARGPRLDRRRRHDPRHRARPSTTPSSSSTTSTSSAAACRRRAARHRHDRKACIREQGQVRTRVLRRPRHLGRHQVADGGEGPRRRRARDRRGPGAAGPRVRAAARRSTIGAVESIVKDVREEYVEEFLAKCLKANALYENKYPLLSAMSRPIIVKHLVERGAPRGREVRRARLHRQGQRPGALRGRHRRARPRPRRARPRARLGPEDARAGDGVREDARHPRADDEGLAVLDRRQPVGPRDRVRRARGPVGGAAGGHLHAHERRPRRRAAARRSTSSSRFDGRPAGRARRRAARASTRSSTP